MLVGDAAAGPSRDYVFAALGCLIPVDSTVLVQRLANLAESLAATGETDTTTSTITAVDFVGAVGGGEGSLRYPRTSQAMWLCFQLLELVAADTAHPHLICHAQIHRHRHTHART